MCLLIQGSKKKAKRDIICYKVMLKIDDKLCSRYINRFKWEIGKTYTCTKRSATRYYKDEIGDGYFHSYSDMHLSVFVGNIVVCKCVIPKDTWYYSGIHSDGIDGYASKSIIVEEIIYENKK